MKIIIVSSGDAEACYIDGKKGREEGVGLSVNDILDDIAMKDDNFEYDFIEGVEEYGEEGFPDELKDVEEDD